MTNQSAVSAADARLAVQSVSSTSSYDRNLGSDQGSSRFRLVGLRSALSLARTLILLGASCNLAPAQTLAPSWYQQSPASSPAGRYIHAVTYDAGHGQVVLFGGFGASGYLNDTWLWNGNTWTQASPANSPSPRAAHATVYDAATGQVVLFGGLSSVSSRLGDTWLWSGANWTQANPSSSPPARDGAVMVYDPVTSQVILFGGVSNAGFDLSDTWAWDGTTWTQLTPASSPSARADYSMAYDAATGQVVLFGGQSNGNYLNDTWTWNGSNWIQQAPANSPPIRYAQGMAYNAALGQVVMFGGYNGNFLNDTWVWDGTNWTQDNPAISPSGRYAPNAMTYDAAQSQVILFGGLGSAETNDTWEWGVPGNFGNINVCPSGQTTPAPCSSTLALTYNVATAKAFGTPQVVTQGATGLDFSLASGNTCIGTISAGSSCAVDVTFAPQLPGLRTGAIQLLDNSGNLLVTTPIYGVGEGPEAAIEPGAQTIVNTTASYPLNEPKGLEVDAAGDVFIADNGNQRVVKVAANGTATTVGFGLNFPQGMAVDGAGDLFIADYILNEVVEVPAGCTVAACQTTVGSGLVTPSGVAVDGSGDLFISDFTGSQVVEVPVGCASSACQTVVYNPGPQSKPFGVAVDATGDVFVADFGLAKVVEIPAACTMSSCQISVGQGWVRPAGVAVDAAGDVFVTDESLEEVLEVPAGCASASCQIPVMTGIEALGVAVDGAGDVFLPDLPNNRIVEVNQSQPQSLSFATTYVGSTSSDSPQSVTLQNIGNQPLSAVSPGLVVSTPNFVQVPGSCTPADCTSTFSLAPGSACNVSISFEPQSGATFAGSVTFDDNNLNITATQSVALSGTGLGVPVIFTVTGSGTGSGFVLSNPTGINCNEIGGVTSGNCSASYPSGSTISLEEIPSSGSTFAGWTGACASSGTNQICIVSVNAATSASATFALNANYPLSVTGVGSGSGTVTSNPTGISCSANNGTNSGTCSSSYAAGTPVTLTAAASGTSIFTGWGGACASAGASATCNVAMNSAMNVSASFVQQNFGNVNVCPPGETTPAPCSSTLPVTFNLSASTTIGAIQVVTQGVTGLDFSLGSGGACTGTIAAGNSCGINVSFTPRAPGLRMGAVKLFDNNGNLIAATPVYGVGQGPAIAFGPAAQAAVNTGSYSLNQVKGVAVDAAGDVFLADTLNQRVVEIGANGTQTTLGNGLQYPQGLAVDGAGDLFIADNNLNEVVEVPAGCTSSSCQKIVGSGLRSQLGVAVDGTGDAYIGDFLDHEVVKVPANGGAQTVVYNPGSASNPVGLAVDGAGDLFVADFGLKTVAEVPAGCVTSSCQITLGGGWQQPDSVAVDAAGDVFVADFGLKEVVEVPAGCIGSACEIVVASGIQTVAAAVDWGGDVFIPNEGNNQVIEVTRALPPSLNFALTNVGATSSDSPQLLSVQNIGNQTLTGSLVLSLGTNFLPGASSTCGSGFSLAPGGTCNESFGFTPQSAGLLTGTAEFSDNTFNLSPLVVLQAVTLSGNGGLNGQAVGTTVPNVVGQTEAAAANTLASSGLTLGAVSTAYSSSEPAGSVIGESPAAGAQVNLGTSVALLISTGEAPPPTPNPLTFENNYFVTGDYASAGVTLRGAGVNGVATGTITIPDSTTSPGVSQGVPDGADIVDGFLYWETLENTPTPSANTGTFLGYPIAGQRIGSDLPYTDGSLSGTLRAYRADVNDYFPVSANGSGVRFASGAFKVSLPDSGGSGFPLTEGASLVVIYRVLSPNFPLKSVVIYDGSATPAASTTQTVQGFYDALGAANGGENTILSYTGRTWNNSSNSVTLAAHASQFSAPLNSGTAYAAVILSTPVTNSDNDGILDAWKSGPGPGDFFAGQPGYYDVKTQSWVTLAGAKHGEKDLFVQLDYMCGAVLSTGACDPSGENLFPSPDPSGNDPLAMVQQAFASDGIVLHLQIGNAVPETTCTDNTSTNPAQLCEFPNEPGVIGWKNSLEYSKLWPRNFASCAAGGDCTARFPYGQKDSYHYVLFGHSLAVAAWNTPYGTLTSIHVVNGVTTIVTADRGAGINECPSRITLSGVQGNPSLNGVYNTSSCPDSQTIVVSTPGIPNWSYPNTTLPEPIIGLTSGTVTSISGYSDLGGSDSAVSLALWETAPNQDMSKRANVIAGTLYHEIGHTLGLSHGGLYYDTPGSYIPTFEVNCKPNYQSVMNYLFQLDGVGPNAAVAYSNQTLTELFESTLQATTQLTDTDVGFIGNAATFPTSAWYTSTAPSSTASAATMHCDGTPLTGDTGYRVTGSIAPITPQWQSGQNITFDGAPYTQLRGYNDVVKIDLRQVGATGGEFASLAGILSFGSSSTSLTVAAGGSAAVGAGGTVTLGSGGTVTLGSGGNVTLSSGAKISGGGTITLGSGGNVTLGSGGTITPGSSGLVTLGSGGNVTLGSGGTITLGSGGTVTLGSGGTVTLGSGGTITLGSGGTVTIPSTGGSYTIDSNGGTITLGSGGNVTLGSGGNVTLGSGGTITLGSGGNVTLGSGGNVTLGSGGTITLGSGGNVTLGSGGNVTLGSGGTVTLGSGGTVTLGSGGNVTLGSGGTVTLGSGGDLSVGSGGNVTLGSGGTVTLGSGGTVTLGSGGNVTLGSGGTITLGSGGTVTLGSGGTVTLGSGGTITLASGGTVTLGSGGTYTIPSGGGTVTLGSGGNVTLGSGGNVTLGSGGTITMSSGGTVTLGSGGNVTLGRGGVVTLGSGGNVTLGSGGNVTLGSGGNVTLGSGGATTTELTYNTANSVVRPPTSPTETPTTAGILVSWNAPAFGVVQTYTVSRSSNGGPAVVIGSVSGVNGNTPATTFIDTTPDLTATNVVYTISTTIVPDSSGSTARQSAPSAPAVLTNNQTIVLNPVPSSVVMTTSPLTVTATSQTNGAANGLEVTFSSTGPCTIGSQSLNSSTGVSSASVSLNSTGSCTITASQSGTSAYNPATPVSGTFTILPQGSSTQSQTINFAPLPNVQYGNTFSLSASSSASLPVSFTISGPCTASGVTTGTGVCRITASAPGNNSYSAASVTQSFTISPAVLTVAAKKLTSAYGQTLPALTYTYGGFVNGDTASVISGVPALSTTATATSNAGNYPITVSTGTLAATNYSFLYGNGILTIQPAAQTITFTTHAPASDTYKGVFVVAATASSGLPVTFTSSGSCTNAGATYTMTSGSGSCSVIANQAGNTNYAAASQVTQTVSATLAAQMITFTTSAPSSAPYNSSFTVAATGGASGNALTFTSAGACSNSGAKYTLTSGTGTCSVIANQAGNTNYAAASQVTQTVSAALAAQTITFTTSPPATAAYNSSFKVVATASSGLAVTYASSGSCSNSGATYTMTNSTGTCLVIASQTGNTNYATAAVTKAVTATGPAITVSPTSVNFGTVYLGSITTQRITVSNAGTAAATINTPLISILQAGNLDEFVVLNLCPSSLAAGKSCNITIAFYPGEYYNTAQTATLKIMDNAPGNPQQVSLSATVIDPLASFSPTSLSFGTVKHATSSTLDVTLSNPGATPLIFTGSGITVSGANAADFVESNNCGSSLAAGAKCIVAVKFTPPTTGTFSAILTVLDNSATGGGTQTIPLSGKGN